MLATSNNSRPMYDARRNPIYQVDCSVASSGKRFSMSKRRIRWRFGFSDGEALAAGKTGTNCRGQEHDVTFVWSLASGKRLVLADGNEVHFSMGNRSQGKFETTWTMKGGHMLKIKAYAALPLKAKPGFRQFDLLIDGLSLFDMPRIFELGVAHGGGGGDVSRYEDDGYGSPAGSQVYKNYSLPVEEEQAWAQSLERAESVRHMDRGQNPRDFRRQETQPFTAPEEEDPRAAHPAERSASEPANVHSFAMPADLVSDPTPVMEVQDLVSAPLPVLDQAPMSFEPQTPQAPPAPTYEQLSSEIMSSYMTPTPSSNDHASSLSALPGSDSNPTLTEKYTEVTTWDGSQQNLPSSFSLSPPTFVDSSGVEAVDAGEPCVVSPMTAVTAQTTSPSAGQAFFSPHSSSSSMQRDITDSPDTAASRTVLGAATVGGESAPSAAPTCEDEDDSLQESQDSPSGVEVEIDNMTKSLNSLVNLEDINSSPEKVTKELKLTMNPFDDGTSKKNNKKGGVVRSRGLEPTAATWNMGANPSLADIQKVQNSVSGKSAPLRPVMNDPTARYQQQEANHSAAPAPPEGGALVVYGQGPPALGAPQLENRGFGAGAQLPNGGYSTEVQYNGYHHPCQG